MREKGFNLVQSHNMDVIVQSLCSGTVSDGQGSWFLTFASVMRPTLWCVDDCSYTHRNRSLGDSMRHEYKMFSVIIHL